MRYGIILVGQYGIARKQVNMTDTQITVLILMTVSLLLIAWDIYVAFFNSINNRHDTISGIFRKSRVSLPYGWGVLAGHFWIGHGNTTVTVTVIPAWLGIIALFDFLANKYIEHNYTKYISLLYLIFGLMAGGLFWPQ